MWYLPTLNSLCRVCVCVGVCESCTAVDIVRVRGLVFQSISSETKMKHGEGGRLRKCGNRWRKKREQRKKERLGGERDEEGEMGMKEGRMRQDSGRVSSSETN